MDNSKLPGISMDMIYLEIIGVMYIEANEAMYHNMLPTHGFRVPCAVHSAQSSQTCSGGQS